MEAGTHLTPYSVSVSGYYRKDGSYVRPHKRRPPGSVEKDAPWKRERFLMGTLFLGSIALGLGSLFYTYTVSVTKINEKESRIKSLKRERNFVHKNIIGKNISRIISKELNFDNLSEYPQYLLHDDKKECAYKHKGLPKTNFHVKYKAIKHYYRVCLEHVSSLPSIGRGQPCSKYIKEIEYYEEYKKLQISFRTSFEIMATKQTFEFSENEIDQYFYMIYKEKTGPIEVLPRQPLN